MKPIAAPAIVTFLSFGFALLLAAGGIMGYVSKQSTISLAAGVASAGVFFWLESSFAADAKAGNAASAFRDSVSLVVAAVLLSGGMGYRWNGTQKFMPAGLVCAISAVMAVVYFLRTAANFQAGDRPHEP